MTRAIKYCANRLRGSAGFTLTEMLAVLVIMTLASTLLATGVPAAQRAYANAVDASNAEVALSATVQQLRERLAVADASSVAAGTGDILISYKNRETNNVNRIKQDSKGIYLEEYYPDDLSKPIATQYLVPQSLEVGSGKVKLVVKFGDGTGDGVSYDSSTKLFTIQGLEVVREGESTSITQLESPITIRPIADN